MHDRLEHFRRPVLAAVNDYVLRGGFELVLILISWLLRSRRCSVWSALALASGSRPAPTKPGQKILHGPAAIHPQGLPLPLEGGRQGGAVELPAACGVAGCSGVSPAPSPNRAPTIGAGLITRDEAWPGLPRAMYVIHLTIIYWV